MQNVALIALNMNMQQEYEDLNITVEEIRLQNEASAQRMRHETEAAYAKKLSKLQFVIDKNVRKIQKQEAELRNAREQTNQMTAQSSDLQSQNRASEEKLVQLETKLRRPVSSLCPSFFPLPHLT